MYSRIPKNRKPRYCPRCSGTMRKAGKYSRQNWECRKCGYRTQYPNR